MPLMKSRLAAANDPVAEFPLNNLPYGVFSTEGTGPRCGAALGDVVIDLSQLERHGLLDAGARVFSNESLNAFMALGAETWAKVRARLQSLFAEGAAEPLPEGTLVPLGQAKLHLPFEVAEFTDFYSGRHHARNVGVMMRGPENSMPPNWLHIPIGYNGRASTVVVSGTPIRRPLGQMKPADANLPVFGPSRRLDIELEMGTVVGTGNRMGEPMSVAAADGAIFGFVLLNDWSARDIQGWEYQPLGPFQSKVFATSISPWVVTKAALEPFRSPPPPRDFELLPYLREPGPMNFDVALEVWMKPAGAARASRIAHTNFREMYYAPAQQLAHHAIGGCRMRTGDLLGSGTVSGPEKANRGCLLELTWGGKEPLTLETGETRTFLEDGDEVALRGWAEGDGYRVGFGACEGRIEAAPPAPF